MDDGDATHPAYDDGLSERIIGLAIKVHRHFGPGLMESVYEACLCHELVKAGMAVSRQVPLPLVYDGLKLDNGYRADLIVERTIILEIKSVERVVPLHEVTDADLPPGKWLSSRAPDEFQLPSSEGRVAEVRAVAVGSVLSLGDFEFITKKQEGAHEGHKESFRRSARSRV